MMTFIYRASFEPGSKKGRVVVTFPDVPEAITQGTNAADARAMAEEALGLALLSYPARGLALPKAKAKGAALIPIAVDPEVAAKLAVLETFRNAGISKSEFARRLGKDEKEVRRILDHRQPTKLATLNDAMRVLGGRLVMAMEAA